MLEIIENKKLVHNWEYPGHSGSSTLTWDLTAVDEKRTLLRLLHDFTISFDSTVAILNISNFEKGWNYIVSRPSKSHF